MAIVTLDQSLEKYCDVLPGFYQTGLENLREHYSPEDLRRHIQERNKAYFTQIAHGQSKRSLDLALTDDKKLQGTLEGLVHEDNGLKIADILWVLASTKGQGIGTKLIEHYISKQNGNADIVALQVSQSNKRAIRLYEKLGFVHVRDHGRFSVYGLGLSEKGKKVI